jgi:hypothetical protein
MKEKFGINIYWARYMADLLQKVGGMAELQRNTKRLEFDTTGTVGDMIHTTLRSALDSYKRFFLNYYNIPEEEYATVVESVITNAINDHSYFDYHCCWGRKSLLSSNDVFHDEVDVVLPNLRVRHNGSLANLSTSMPLVRTYSFNVASFELGKEKKRKNKKSHSTGSYWKPEEIFSDIDQFSAGFED